MLIINEIIYLIVENKVFIQACDNRVSKKKY